MNILGNNLSKTDVLKAKDRLLHRMVDAAYKDFTVSCQVDLGVMQQNFLVDAVFRKVEEMCKASKHPMHPRSIVTLRSLFEWVYLMGWTDILEAIGLVGDDDGMEYIYSDRQAHNMAQELDLIQILSDADPKAKKMFDTMWQAVLARAETHERLLAANLANQKLNTLIEKAEGLFTSFTEAK